MCGINAYSEAVKLFKDKDPWEILKNSGASFELEKGIFRLTYFGSPVEVKFSDGDIKSESARELVKNDKILILQYLIFACGAHPRGTWIPFFQLPDDPRHHVPFINEALIPLAVEFGENLTGFSQRLQEFRVKEINMGDFGAVVPVFPKLPLAIYLWQGDDEFPANANILFDVTAPLHLSTAALWVLGVELSRKLRNTISQQYINKR